MTAWPHEGVDFTGKRVGIIGTGSSGVQTIPIVAEQADHLTVFQRTPPYALPLRNCPMPADYEREVKANYHEWRRLEHETFGGYIALNWQPAHYNTMRTTCFTGRSALEVSEEERRAEYEMRYANGGLCMYNSFSDLFFNPEANETLASFLKEKIRERVKDPAIAETLMPDYPVMTKRLCGETGFYETFNRDDVTLVDVKKDPISAITPDGLTLRSGAKHQFDSLILATGYDAGTGAMVRMDIRGRNGRQLADHWADGPRTHLGMMSHGFPNLFMVNGPQSPSAFFQPVLLGEYQGRWIADCLRFLEERNLTRIEATEDAEANYGTLVDEAAAQTLLSHANGWYIGANIEGKPRKALHFVALFSDYQRCCQDAVANGYAMFNLGAPEVVAAT